MMRTVIGATLGMMAAACAAPTEDAERPHLRVARADTSARFETPVPNPPRFRKAALDCTDEAGHALFETDPRPRLTAPAWLAS